MLAQNLTARTTGPKVFKVQDIIDAVQLDGFEHLRGTWINTFDGKITGGCVLGQGAVNLGVAATPGLGIYHYQDVVNTLNDALQKFSVDPDSKWGRKAIECFDNEISLDAGTVITGLNDHGYWEHPDGRVLTNNQYDAKWMAEVGGFVRKYTLATYAEVAQMVAEVLEPFKDEAVTIQTVDYSSLLSGE